MSTGGSGSVMTRPAAPGRRRTPASRNVSSASSTARADDTPSRTVDDSYTADQQNLVNRSSASMVYDGSTEIPFEEVERALSGLSRDDLILALKRAKEQLDILDNKLDNSVQDNEGLHVRVDELVSQLHSSQAEVASLQVAVRRREERVDELMMEQDRDEGEVYDKLNLIERLRKQLRESEKARNEAERRYEEQASTTDKERQYFSEMEVLLQTQKAKASTAHERTLSSNRELSRENDKLHQLVSQLRNASRGYSRSPGPGNDSMLDNSLLAGTGDDSTNSSALTDQSGEDDEHDVSFSSQGIRTLQDEAKSLKVEALHAELSALQKHNEMMQAQLHQVQVDFGQLRVTNEELRDQNETYMDILQEKTLSGALITESAVLNRRYFDSDTDTTDSSILTDNDDADADDVPDHPKQMRGKRRQLTTKSSMDLSNLPTSLASELEKSEDQIEDSDPVAGKRRDRKRERSEILGNDIEKLHKEIWDLRDANQALTLYITKIVDRIISREGYENVLAIDGDDKSKLGTLRGTSSRMRGQQSRPSIFDSSARSPTASAGRLVSGTGLFSLIGGGGGAGAAEEESAPKTPTIASPALSQRGKRTASIDWRGLIGVGSPASPHQQQHGQAIAATSNLNSIGEDSIGSIAPRKIRSSEEVEDADDKEEKDKIRKELLSHGIALPENQLKSQKRQSAFSSLFSKMMGGGAGATATAPEVTSAKSNDSALVRTSSGSTVDRGDQHPGPRVTVFDNSNMSKSPALARTSTVSSRSSSVGGMERQDSSDAISRQEARQRALDVGSSTTTFTDVPVRTSPISSRRSTIMKRRETSDSASSDLQTQHQGDLSRGESVGGDESYIFDAAKFSQDPNIEQGKTT